MQQKHVVTVKLTDGKEILADNANQIDVKPQDKVVVYYSQNYDVATVTSEERIVDESSISKKEICKIIRKLTEADLQRIKENSIKAQEAYKIIKQTCASYELPIKIVHVEYSFDRTKLYVYYTQEKPVNLNKIVHEFAHKFKTRIEMKQIGPRDETKILGGIGVCGQILCCKRWIKKFESISVEMAKTQQLALNIPKLSGVCNRLKCCLYYEYQFYKECVDKMPKIGSKVHTTNGEGKVVGLDCIKNLVSVELKTPDGDTIIKTFPAEQVK